MNFPKKPATPTRWVGEYCNCKFRGNYGLPQKSSRLGPGVGGVIREERAISLRSCGCSRQRARKHIAAI